MILHSSKRKPQRGVAAIEFALALPLMLVLLALPLYLGWYQYHSNTAQKAALNAARYLSKIPQAEIINPYRAPAVVSVAEQMVLEMISELRPGPIPPTITIACNGIACVGGARPTTVSVTIQMTVEDTFFPRVTQMYASIAATAKLPYLGR